MSYHRIYAQGLKDSKTIIELKRVVVWEISLGTIIIARIKSNGLRLRTLKI